jgi:hypothetical protein
MEDLWKLASEFIGDGLLNTKAYLMYHGKEKSEEREEVESERMGRLASSKA